METLVERDCTLSVGIAKFGQDSKTFLQNAINRGTGHEGAGVEPCLSDLLMEELYVTVTREDIVGVLGGGKWLVPACVDELNRQGLDTVWATMVLQTSEVSNVMPADVQGPGLSFRIGRAWRCDTPPHERWPLVVVERHGRNA